MDHKKHLGQLLMLKEVSLTIKPGEILLVNDLEPSMSQLPFPHKSEAFVLYFQMEIERGV